MKKLIILALLNLFFLRTFATGEPSTYFNIFVPPNNDAVGRNVCLIITAIYDSTAFTIVDDGMDGDTDDSKTGILMAGQSYILYIKDNGINDDASGASTGVLKQDGDYFIITSDKLVFASQSTDSDWQHDWLPSVNKKSTGEKFIIYAPKISSSLRDVNVFTYSDSTLVKIKKISTIAKTTTGFTSVSINTATTIATFSLNIGEDIIYKYAYGRNTLQTGETYLIESSKPITVQYGALYVNERDGGGYVPSSNGSSAGELFYFGVPYQAVGEQEIRIVSWDNTNAVTLERYSAGTWITMNTWNLNHFQPADWVGKNNGNVSYPTVFRVKCSPGKKVSIFEGNWFETGSPGTSDMATMVSSDNGTSSGKNFLVYMAPPGNEQNVLNPFTNQKFNQRLTHVYLFAKKLTSVTIKDSYTNGLKISKTYTIQPDKYVDCYLTETEWKNIYNGTGTTAGGPARPYLTVTSDEDISLMNTNFNDNWMMYFGSALPQSITQTSSSTKNNAVPGDTVTFKSNIIFKGTDPVINPSIEVAVTSGASVQSSKLIDVQHTDTINGNISQTVNKTIVTFDSVATLVPTNQYYVETKILVVPVNNQGTNINNSIVSVETIITGEVAGETQQSVVNDGLTVNRLTSVDATTPIFTAPTSITLTPNAAGCTATVVLTEPAVTDNVGVIYVTNNAPSNFNVGNTTFTWTAYDAAGNNSSITQVVTVIAPVLIPPSVTSASLCSGNSILLNATTVNGDIEWFSVSTGGTAIQNGNSYQTPILNNSVTYYVGADLFGCNSSRTPLIVIVKTTPLAPAVIQPTICSGNSTSLFASVPSGSIKWYNSNNTLIGSNPTYNTPILNVNTTYLVQNIANGCVGYLDTVNVTVNQTPNAPDALGTNVCLGMQATVSATRPGGNYQWYDALTNGNLLATNSSLTLSNLTTSKNVYVQTTINGCVSLRKEVLIFVTTTIPDDISPTISGLVLLCNQDTITYTTGAANFGYTYNWALPTGMTILNGQGTRTITALANTNTYITGAITVNAVNACGVSNPRFLDINLPGAITGLDKLCSVNSATYSIGAVNGATNYTWNLPNGITGSSTTNSIVVAVSQSGFSSGNISVTAKASCGSTSPKLKLISAQTGTPGAIYGQAVNVCGNTSKTYSITPVANASQYNWSAPIGSIILGSTNNTFTTNNNSITVTFPANFTTGKITVSSSNNCYTSASKSITIIKSPTGSSPGIISGPTNVCSIIGTTSSASYSIVPVSGVSNYLWVVPSNATLMSGQGTTQISVKYNNQYNGGNILVASVGTCTNSASRSLGVGKVPSAVSNVFGPTSLCSIQGLNASYSVAPISDASGYIWTIPTGGNVISGNNTNNITVAYSNSVVANSKITVRATNSCGGSTIKTITITPCVNARIASVEDENDETQNINNSFTLSELYPNPTNGDISFDISSDKESEIEIYIFDLLGQQVYYNQTTTYEGKSKVDIDLTELSKAYYVVHINDKTNNKSYVKRLIKE
ncbi:MAG: HYR domain-containing protein [Bacteroidia bacterium]|nr:HYR domain-containing protein [Bacteroidia bacterium]